MLLLLAGCDLPASQDAGVGCDYSCSNLTDDVGVVDVHEDARPADALTPDRGLERSPPTLLPIASSGGEPRLLAGIGLSNRKITIVGGETTSSVASEVIRYAEVTSSWEHAQPMPAGRAEHVVVSTDDEMYVFGGRTADNRYPADWLVLKDDDWRSEAAPAGWSGRRLHTATLMDDGRIVVLGGLSADGVPLADVLLLDPTNGSSKRFELPASLARAGHVAVYSNELLFVWGGQGAGGVLNTGFKLDVDSMQVLATSTTGAPASRALSQAALLGTDVVLFGGVNGGGLPTDPNLYRYSVSQDRWLAVASTLEPRVGHAMAVVDGWIVVLGGLSRDAQIPMPVAFDSQNEFLSEPVGDPQGWSGRYASAFLVMRGGLVVWGGRDRHSNRTDGFQVR